MPKSKPVGHCRLCGRLSPLSKEHIPAKGAFKGRQYRVRVLTGEKAFEGGGGRIYQRGFHANVLCEECNKKTGAWYGDEFAAWSQWGLQLLDALRQRPVPNIPAYTGYPLRIAKQVVSTMIAASSTDLTTTRPDLAPFVLDRDATAPAGSVRLSTYLCPTSTGRSTGLAFAMVNSRQPHWLVEFALPPFGYVLTVAGDPLDPRPVDISWFTACAYGERRPIDLDHVPILPTHEPFPGDYRTKDQIRRDFIINTLTAEGHGAPETEADRIVREGEGPGFFSARGEEW